MRRAITVLVAGAGAVVLFGLLVHGVLVAGHVSEPAAVTVHGLTARRSWATGAVVLALAGVGSGALALARRRRCSRLASARRGALIALGAGFVAAVNGALNVALATGGPGTGNGVVGGAAAFVLGLAAVALGALALGRRRGVTAPAAPSRRSCAPGAAGARPPPARTRTSSRCEA